MPRVQPFWDIMDEAHRRQADRLERAARARLRAEAAGTSSGAPLALRAARLLRNLADVLEARAVRTAA